MEDFHIISDSFIKYVHYFLLTTDSSKIACKMKMFTKTGFYVYFLKKLIFKHLI